MNKYINKTKDNFINSNQESWAWRSSTVVFAAFSKLKDNVKVAE